MDERTRAAIARIDTEEGGRGTGSLVAPGLVLTALHVVGNRKSDPVVFYRDIQLSFPGHKTKATPVDGMFDPGLDWCLLRCEVPPSVRPLPIADLSASGGPWNTYGFPDAQPIDGMVTTGTVKNHRGKLTGFDAFQLYSEEAAAGSGAPVSGFSGAPVLVDDAVVGLLRFALMDGQKQARAGTLYACPVTEIVLRSGELLPIPDPCASLPGLPHQPLPAMPFRFLKRYTAADAEVFFGRKRETRDLYRLIDDPEAPPVVLLYGRSGVGKSSFLDAGLFPRLSWHYDVRYLRRDVKTSLLDTVRGALADRSAAGGDVEDPSWSPLPTLWTQAEEERPVVVLLDQVEEVYTRRNPRHGRELGDFCDQLKDFAPRGKLVLSFRKEWFPEIQKQLTEAGIDFRRFFLEPLDEPSVVETVNGLESTQRLRDRYNLAVEETLPQMVAHDLLADPESPVAPTLQILLTKMWQAAVKENLHEPQFAVQRYVALKAEGVHLHDFLRQQLRRVRVKFEEQVDSGLALDLLAQHTTAMQTSQQCDLAELRAKYGNHPEFEDLLASLRQNYLLVDTGGDGAGQTHSTRLAHDTLAVVVRATFDASTLPGQRAERILNSRSEWADGKEGAPLGAHDLATVEQGLGGMRAPTVDEERLLEASRRERGRKKRFGRIVKGVIGLLMLGIFALWRISEFNLEKSERDEFRAEMLATTDEVDQYIYTQPTDGLTLAVWAACKDLTSGYEKPHGQAIHPSLLWSLNYAFESAREYNHWKAPGTVTALAFNPGATSLAAAFAKPDGQEETTGTDGSACIYPVVRDGGEFGRILPGRKGGGDVTDVAWTPFGQHVVTVDESGFVRVWSARGNLLGELGVSQKPLRAVVALDHATVAVAGEDGRIRTCDIVRQVQGRSLESHAGPVHDLAFDPRAGLLVSGGDDGVRIWEWPGGKQLPKPARHGHSVLAVGIATGEKDGIVRIASGGGDSVLRICEIDGKSFVSTDEHKFHGITCIDFSPDGQYVVSGDNGNRVRITNVEGVPVAPEFLAPDGTVRAVAYAPRAIQGIEGVLVVGGDDHYIRIRDPRGAMIGDRMRPADHPVESVACSPDGTLLATGSSTGRLSYWLADGTRFQKDWHDESFRAAIHELCWLDDQHLVGTCKNGKLRLWDRGAALRKTYDLAQTDGESSRTNVVRQGGRVAASGGNEVVLFDWLAETSELREASRWTAHTEREGIQTIALSRDGKLLATAARYDIHIWDVTGTSPTRVHSIETLDARVLDLAFGLEDDLYCGCADSKLRQFARKGRSWAINRVVDTVTGEVVAPGEVVAHTGEVAAVVVSETGDRVATGGKDGVVKLWNPSDLKIMGELLYGHTHTVNSLDFGGTDEMLLVSGSDDGTAILWRAHYRLWLDIAADRLLRHPDIRLNSRDRKPRAAVYDFCHKKPWNR